MYRIVKACARTKKEFSAKYIAFLAKENSRLEKENRHLKQQVKQLSKLKVVLDRIPLL